MFWLVCASFAGGIKAEKTRLMGLKVPDTGLKVPDTIGRVRVVWLAAVGVARGCD